LNLPDDPRPGTFEKVNCLVAVAEEVLMMKTCMPLLEGPAKYSGVEVVGIEEDAVNGLAGVPIFGSWWKARSSRFLIIESCWVLNLLS